MLAENDLDNVSDLGGWNSSGQRPERNAAHNKDIADNFPRGHLLNMPTLVQRRIFAKVLRHDEPLIISPTAEAEREAANDLALLQVCRATRKEAVPLYYVVNSFEVKVENFHASKLLPWYEQAIMHRGNAVAMPIVLAGGEEDCTNWWAMEDNKTVVKDGFKKGQQLQLQRLKPFKDISTTAQAPRGDIKLAVTYSPNWTNLKEWLHLYHEGRLPNLMNKQLASEDAGGNVSKMIGTSGASQADIDDLMNDIDEDEEPAFQDPTPRLKRCTLPPSCDPSPTKAAREHATVSNHRLSPTAPAQSQTQDTFSTPMATSEQVIDESDNEDDDKEDDGVAKHLHPPSAAGTGGPRGFEFEGGAAAEAVRRMKGRGPT
ncbi:uncharacterized protein MYCGRDRAFT_94789 [Zymoseptoria tritici IPO323]|uniref:Uncharacterized protein n=1 Tax=Zymoseptoria tritici (strain CBS 115943 / IPO323) TaxID=336722 RepID=F9XF62_ZYMTI|nr:uncharacterized protein MYCGRDRAFT_94789 [Zymoseptoria tritici IPO323]EGP85870.1 hypothetical protein MYCGRDRAFT_94789 [Zymoseptoria tritici IPO323]